MAMNNIQIPLHNRKVNVEAENKFRQKQEFSFYYIPA